MNKKFTEENGVYSIDCTKALWATDKIHDEYQNSGVHINDVDFVIEDSEDLMLAVEYKNANIEGASRPEAFNPNSDNKVMNVVRKFYDSLPYLHLIGKTKPVRYIYVLEWPNSDEVTRKRLRNRLRAELPFVLQESIEHSNKIIEQFEVLSITKWNTHNVYKKYPISLVN